MRKTRCREVTLVQDVPNSWLRRESEIEERVRGDEDKLRAGRESRGKERAASS